MSGRIVEVAAAVLRKPDGSFLLAQRPADKIWAGYWEFPGGKIEAGESPRVALERELREELGVQVETAYPWLTRVFDYPHATVRLHFFRVTAWSGELHPHEGQEFAWQNTEDVGVVQDDQILSFPRRRESSDLIRLDSRLRGNDGLCNVTVSPVLPANAPILRALSLPLLYAISNAHELGEEIFMQRLQIALKNGLRLVQLREKNYARDALRALALRMLPLLREHGALLLINAEVELAQEIGADGVHLTGAQIKTLTTRPDVQWCGASCHDMQELRRAEELGCDLAALSPVLPTLSHPGEPTLGWEKFAECVAGAAIPVYALGGLQQADMHQAWQQGAHGIALLRQAW